MKRILTETKVKNRFTEHDLRAKVASDESSLEHAQSMLTLSVKLLIEFIVAK